MTTLFDVLIIGGGPAGVTASIWAANGGRSVLLLEGQNKIGKKWRITGGGRCNVTNACDPDIFLSQIPKNARFLSGALYRFPPSTVQFYLEKWGVPLKTEAGGRVFPQSEQAKDVIDAFVQEAKKNGVQMKMALVKNVQKKGEHFFVFCADGKVYESEQLVIATGGLSYPKTGSTGDGYRLAKQLGHSVTKIQPGLSGLILGGSLCKDCQGVTLSSAGLSICRIEQKKPIFLKEGSLIFTHYGMAGPLAQDASLYLREKEEQIFSLDWVPQKSALALEKEFQGFCQKQGAKNVSSYLESYLPGKTKNAFFRLAQMDPSVQGGQLSRFSRQKLITLLKKTELVFRAFRPAEEAVVTVGGIPVEEIHPVTMESKCCRGLYFAGEILDVVGPTGGYNLQIAFSTGALAGMALGKEHVS